MTRRLPIVDIARRKGAERPVPAWSPAFARGTLMQDAALAVARAASVPVEADPFNILILNYTMKCPLACDYCCYTCGPRREETMDLALALQLVDQAAELGVFTECGFTGGEPLVFFDDIVAITSRMADRGFPFSMISACDWAVDDASTRAKIDPLAERGLSVFTVSHDPSHERWVPRAHVRRVVERVLHHGVRAVVCGSFYDDTTTLESMFPEYADNPRISLVTRVVLPTVGRSAKKPIATESYPNADLTAGGTCYKRLYHDVTVFWDGEVYPCCSVYNRSTPGLSYGNVYETPLAEIWDRIAGSLFLRMIKREGFPALLHLVRVRAPDLADRLPDPASTVGPCHLCHQLMGDSELAARVHDVFAEEERARVAQILRDVTDRHGDATALRLIRNALQASRGGPSHLER